MPPDAPPPARDLIKPEAFDASMIGMEPHAWCGDQVYAVEATEWFHGYGDHSARYELEQGTRIWTYKNIAGDRVGFGSLGETTWVIDGAATNLQLIPMLGIFVDHQSQPFRPAPVPKYCYQVIDHILDVATERRNQMTLIGLSVHPENAKAIRLYENSGFVWLRSDQGYSRMFLAL